MRAAGDRSHGRRLRALIVLLWRAGLRIHEALALPEGDLDQPRGSLLIRHGEGGRRREVGLDTWGWEELRPWLERRPELPVGALLSVHQWHHVRVPLVARCGTRGAAAHGGRGRSSAPLAAHRLAPRPRRRDGPRRRPADRDPAPTRPQQPSDSRRLPARHRQRRNHRDRARATSAADDSGQRLRATLIHRPGAAPLIARSASAIAALDSAGHRQPQTDRSRLICRVCSRQPALLRGAPER